MLKECNKCNTEKTENDFQPSYWKLPTGRQRVCRECVRSRDAQKFKKKKGYVYIISNPAWEGWYKIGVAVDLQKRINNYNTGSPFRDYKVEYAVETDDTYGLERQVHDELSKQYNNNYEWFNISLKEAKNWINMKYN